MATVPLYLKPHMTDVERANAELVLGYFKQWEGDFDPADAFQSTFAADARLRYESGAQSPVQWDMASWHIGGEKIIATNRQYVDMGFAANAQIHEVYACGPLVVVHRTDHCTMPGTPDRAVQLIGVFMVINGEIVEWTDYYANRTADGQGTD